MLSGVLGIEINKYTFEESPKTVKKFSRKLKYSLYKLAFESLDNQMRMKSLDRDNVYNE